MGIEERLIGFDVRELLPDPEQLWDRARRETYLLRREVRRPLSVDAMVWPSAFDTGQGVGLPEPERVRLRLAGVPASPWIGPNAGLWDDLERMLRHLDGYPAVAQPHAVVAVTWCSDDGFARGGLGGPYLTETTPAALGPDWHLLGYDVADGSLVSGLANCGYSPAEAASLGWRWAAHLNEHHLFDDPARALKFRDQTNTRVPEHAPFFVYGLYQIGS
jgi:hypothetical protein